MSSLKVDYKGDMLFQAQVGGNRLTIDVPPTLKGKDRGATPTELFAASLAACIGVMVTAFCENMKIDAAGLSVEMEYDKLDKPSRLGNFRVKVRLPSGDWEKHREALLRVAERCPVHETIRMHEGMQVTLER